MLGDEVTRNSNKMIEPDYWSDSMIRKINTGAKFEIVEEMYLYTFIQNKKGDKYKVGPKDLKKFFSGITTNEEVIEETKLCTCDSRDLMFYGCNCGAIENKLDQRIEKMWSGIGGK